MRITRFSDAKTYEAKQHFQMAGLQLHGGLATATDDVSISLSYFLPGGGAHHSASPTEKFYIVLKGALTVITDDGEQMLAELDSCHLAAGEGRSIINRGNEVATMLVVIVAAKDSR